MPRVFSFPLSHTLFTFILVSLLTFLAPQQLHAQAIAQQGQFPSSIMTRTSLSTELNPLILKAIQSGNGQIFNVGGFKQDFTNVIITQNNSQLNIFSFETIEKAKIKTSTLKNMLDLQRTGFNSFYIDNLATGIYTLDVVVDRGNTKAAYEGILVMGQITQEVLQKEITARNTALDGTFVFQNSVKPK